MTALNKFSASVASILTFCGVFYSCGVSAQIVPDSTLLNNSTVNIEGQINRITGGTTTGNNLFHSFREFSLLAGDTAYFDNAVNIQNIFSRVTGRSISNIDGLIRANGNANLFLLNPNGIIFWPNARLNIGGSFLATTANSIVFSDKTSFSATHPQTAPLLTVNVPIGLQFGNNPGTIRVTGTGHNLSRPDPAFGEIKRGNNITGLRVGVGQTLALVGGDISLEGGVLEAPGGRIELGSVSSEFVGINPNIFLTAEGSVLDYSEVPSFRDIQLSQLASIDASGNGGGSISVQGRRVSVREGSAILIQNYGSQPAGQVSINASESAEIIGTAPDLRIRSSVANETIGAGASGGVVANTGRLLVRDGGIMFAATFTNAQAGNVTVNASDSVEVSGFSLINPRFFSYIASPTYSSGAGGKIVISTERLRVLGGAVLASLTFGTGNAEDITINAAQSVEVLGSDPIFLQPSAISSSTFNAGNSGNLRLNTSILVLKNGGSIGAGTFSSGNSGSVIINADSVEMSGIIPGGFITGVSSPASITSEAFRQRFQLPRRPSGASGDVTVNTSRLIIRDGAGLGVGNQGSGNAGNLKVNADEIIVSNGGVIEAETIAGEGGNIMLQTRNLQLRSGGQITATAGGTGNGGNLSINADAIAIIEKSDITANAVGGRGGNIQIVTQGLFQSSDSAIAASSQFGVSGAVQLSTPDLNPSAGLVQLPENTMDATALIGQDPCKLGAESSFTIAGKGGLPNTPEEPLSSSATVVEWASNDKEISRDNRGRPPVSAPTMSGEKSDFPADLPPLVEATGWVVNGDGNVVLTANALNSEYTPGLTNPSCHEPVPKIKN